ncbi:Plastidal glycolate/glycerate translocator 1, chloroplastic [Cytospora mali]|uniref:Plastidal glycolate/glycerate translocator 1, chloroplastic n=1 Tax=Cytospora mali TaxID=578113 RepID=A0A194V5C9_CYTMA|nr:Plastidal glycolate/glycerate translocator 1, chloroplastic [Valsa mali var. pyri (nom. inval.)]
MAVQNKAVFNTAGLLEIAFDALIAARLAGWSLRWISVFFTPTFVTLPLSPSISGAEVGKVIAVFVLGFAVMFVITAYMTRGLQLITGSHKKAQAARAEELGPQEDEIPMSQTPLPQETPLQSTDVSAHTSAIALTDISAPGRSHEPTHTRPLSAHPSASPSLEPPTPPASPPPLPQQSPPAPPRARLWSAIIQSHLDTIIYLIFLVFIGIPVYYADGYAMPLHLTFTILMYFVALSLPLKWRQFLHPVIVSALFTVLGIWIFGLIQGHGKSLDPILEDYTTGLKYLKLWEHSYTTGQLPGAGDILSTVLDASIVGLALPMYQYRRELVEHFVAIIAPNVILSIGSLYAYPSLCYVIGISAPRSLAFASRSLTLALAIPATANLGGDEKTVAAVAIMSGIVGALIGSKILTWMKIPEALLLRTDPRAAALSSLSMSLFGTITVLFTSIPPIANAVKGLVGV